MTPKEMTSDEFRQALVDMGLSEQQIIEIQLVHYVQCLIVAMLQYGSETGVREFDLPTLEIALKKKHPGLDEKSIFNILEAGLSSSIAYDLVKVEESKYLLTINGKMTAISILRQQREVEDTYQDLAVYSVIAQLVNRGKWAK